MLLRGAVREKSLYSPALPCHIGPHYARLNLAHLLNFNWNMMGTCNLVRLSSLWRNLLPYFSSHLLNVIHEIASSTQVLTRTYVHASGVLQSRVNR